MSEIKDKLIEMNNAFGQFVIKNNSRIDDLNDHLQEVEAKINRKGLGGAMDSSPSHNSEYSRAFDKFARKGIDGGLMDMEVNAGMRTDSDPDGGYAVPEEIDKTISKTLRDLNPMRELCNIVRVGTSDYKKLVSTGGTGTGWVGETEARPETNTPQFSQITPPIGEIYANPAVTQQMLDDGFFPVESWLAEELAEEFALQEGTAFVSGDGTKKPKGFLSYTTAATADDTRDFGTLQYVPTGVADDFPASSPSDILISLVHSLRAPYRKGAAWVMNTSTLATVRKFKDGNGDYIWRAGMMEGQPSMLLGYPVYEVADMPDVAAAALPIAFGNFKRGYTITDHVRGVRVLRDPYTNKPYVHFYTTKRVGGGLVNSQAIKLLKIAAS